MTIYLRHPVHGTKVAVMAMEAEYDEQNGWERYDPNAVEEVEEVAPEETVAEVAPSNELEVKRRRGRPSAAAAA
jgi:hypothetical protein